MTSWYTPTPVLTAELMSTVCNGMMLMSEAPLSLVACLSNILQTRLLRAALFLWFTNSQSEGVIGLGMWLLRAIKLWCLPSQNSPLAGDDIQTGTNIPPCRTIICL